MSEAKDTIMSESRIRATCRGEDSYWIGELGESAATDEPPVLMPQFRRLVNKQAEITWDIAFQAGERKVVEWIIAHKKGYYAKPDGTLISIISAEWTEEEWQEFLKSEETE